MSYSVTIYDMQGKKVDVVILSPAIFDDSKINTNLIHEYYLLQQSNARVPIAHTKTRGEVAGSGRKLYRQKGTGNARVGDLRSPLRRKGGVVFGPRSNRNFIKYMNKKSRKQALFGLLTLKAKDNMLVGLDSFDLPNIKTQSAVSVLHSLGLDNKKVLIILDKKNENVEKSVRNIPGVKYLYVSYLNPFDLLYYDVVLFTRTSLDILQSSVV